MFLGYQVFHSEYPYNVSQISHKGICLKKIKNKLEKALKFHLFLRYVEER